MPKYPVLFPLQHNGNRFSVGQTVEMPKADGEKLQDMGVLGTAVQQTSEKTGKE
jgi:hypothetical protein